MGMTKTRWVISWGYDDGSIRYIRKTGPLRRDEIEAESINQGPWRHFRVRPQHRRLTLHLGDISHRDVQTSLARLGLVTS
jgi:hypothetical protein